MRDVSIDATDTRKITRKYQEHLYVISTAETIDKFYGEKNCYTNTA